MEHHVYFWLKDERKNAADRATFEAGLEELGKSVTISSAHWGRPAATEKRPVTDHSWDYGTSVRFETMKAHDAYQVDDPHHVAFVSAFRDWWAKVLVMDLE